MDRNSLAWPVVSSWTANFGVYLKERPLTGLCPSPRFSLIALVVALGAFLMAAAPAAAAEFSLVTETEGNGSGSIECDVEGGGAGVCAAEYPEGTEIAFVAQPDE